MIINLCTYSLKSSPMSIVTQNISKTYGSGSLAVHALRPLSLTIPNNIFLCLAGPSGSGKSTLLQLLGLLDLPSTGSIRINDTMVPNTDSPIRDQLRAQHIGFIFQRFHLMERLRVYENIALSLRITHNKTLHNETELIQEALEAVQLSDKINRYPKELSGGEQQRVAIARAICKKPTLLIADEPTANLDSQTSLHIIKLLHKLHQKQKMTIVCASHDPLLIQGATHQGTLLDGSLEVDL